MSRRAALAAAEKQFVVTPDMISSHEVLQTYFPGLTAQDLFSRQPHEIITLLAQRASQITLTSTSQQPGQANLFFTPTLPAPPASRGSVSIYFTPSLDDTTSTSSSSSDSSTISIFLTP